ncbi:MAG: His/Gly/Thr/Pro-type tRNA ligase C-terminal domain-containing protein [Fimbriimonadaceae bacterium]
MNSPQAHSIEKLALCGGGRYDELIQQMGGQPTPALALASVSSDCFSSSRAFDLIPNPDAPDAFLIAPIDARKPVQICGRLLRSEGYTVNTISTTRKMKQQFKQADRFGARYAVILGEDEIESTYTINWRPASRLLFLKIN